MLKKPSYYWAFAALGAALLAAGFLLPQLSKAWQGALLGVGAGLLAGNIANLISKYRLTRDPKAEAQEKVDWNDERNAAIRQRARAQAGRATPWLVIFLAYLMILSDAPLWLILSAVLVFLFYHVYALALELRYQKTL